MFCLFVWLPSIICAPCTFSQVASHEGMKVLGLGWGVTRRPSQHTWLMTDDLPHASQPPMMDMLQPQDNDRKEIQFCGIYCIKYSIYHKILCTEFCCAFFHHHLWKYHQLLLDSLIHLIYLLGTFFRVAPLALRQTYMLQVTLAWDILENFNQYQPHWAP